MNVNNVNYTINTVGRANFFLIPSYIFTIAINIMVTSMMLKVRKL